MKLAPTPKRVSLSSRFASRSRCPAIVAGGAVVDGQLHAAGDVHAHGVGDDGVLDRQHAADGQAVADVRVGHERARHGHRQRARVGHLLDGGRFQALAPLVPGREFGARRERRTVEHPRERGAQRVGKESGRIGDNLANLRFQLGTLAALSDEAPDELMGETKRFTGGHAQAE